LERRGVKRSEQVLWRSQYERKIREWLDAYGVRYKYEGAHYAITVKIPGVKCADCGSKAVYRDTTYTPDFYFRDTGVVMEAKGKFDARARKIALAMQEQHPHIDYRILLQRDNWISGKKKQRYSDWLKKHQIPYAVGKYPPPEWCVPPGSSVQPFAVPLEVARYTRRTKQRRKS